jgi:hypothetical protein
VHVVRVRGGGVRVSCVWFLGSGFWVLMKVKILMVLSYEGFWEGSWLCGRGRLLVRGLSEVH